MPDDRAAGFVIERQGNRVLLILTLADHDEAKRIYQTLFAQAQNGFVHLDVEPPVTSANADA